MQSTPNYLWELDDLLGQGATASVYKARNKKSGEEVAVKVFNNLSYLRPLDVQMREFEMLRKLKHVNIVKLFTVEETGNSKQKVLVMEYCSSGSLLSVLEDPENAYGLCETEFLIVLQCVVAGMNHLRQNGIVHRDIKPGNIMRLIGEDGRSIYKLTDFGAARELDDDEKFISIYGTEEYLHPDIYERAVLKKPQQKAYGVTVDLWSIGVTFYHAACGSLPFIPYGGPRRNKEIMHKIITEKPSTAIAGVQRKEKGPIEWIYELPISCRLSVGLKIHLENILPNILEADQEKCWGFDKFFEESNNILERLVVHVFSLPHTTMHLVYVHACSSVVNFMEAVFRQTGVAIENQKYFYEGHHYPMMPSLQVKHINRTTQQHPFMLVSSTSESIVDASYKDPTNEFPRFLPSVDVVADCSIAKNVLSAVYQTLRVSQTLFMCQEFILRGTYWLIENTTTECHRILEKKSAMASLLNCTISTDNRITKLYNSVNSRNPDFPEFPDLVECRRQLQSFGHTLSSCSHIVEKQKMLGFMLLEVSQNQDQIQLDTSINRMEFCLQKMKLIFSQFKKRKQQSRLGYNEEQIHKLDKVNLGNLAKKVLSIFQDGVVQKYQAALDKHTTRMSTFADIQKHVDLVNEYIGGSLLDLQKYQDSVSNTVDNLALRIQQMPVQPNHSPLSSCRNQDKEDLTLRMLKLRDQMKTVSCELEQNNSVIERLGVTSSPGV
ncbi:inhibitor of nuclear factor kappa B kinase subunit epsilon L homeolog [Xenopus laevis]|uniref:Serine/threonine-protein kinase TBK1 n=1 Tax=Xenopus laevis TaxID=8355 RepID=Q32NR7_XENLA|nr:inhibitor of nuclear factor kappa B kinase subunit epsilon L homeolog [Xenopus laevis]AAI08512.1 MGC130907 protein [Xenopus laevis]